MQYRTIFSDILVLVHTLLGCVWVLALLIYQEECTPVIGARQNSRTGIRRLETFEGENMQEGFYSRRMQVPFCVLPSSLPPLFFFLFLKSSVLKFSQSYCLNEKIQGHISEFVKKNCAVLCRLGIRFLL